MLSVVPNIVFAPNMMQNAERKHGTQNTNTAHFRTPTDVFYRDLFVNIEYFNVKFVYNPSPSKHMEK